MIDPEKTLAELLGETSIARIAPDAIRNMDLSQADFMGKTLAQLREARFGGDLAAGFERLFAAARSGAWYYPLYSQEECAKEPSRAEANLVWFPAEGEGAEDRPYVLLVPGGGFVNVWNLTEGWPIAAQFNALGYSVFILTYRVAQKERLLDREMEDFARAIRLIRERAEEFQVDWRRYITCGFSAGGYLVCLWNVPEKGYALYGLPAPQAVFPVYPLTSWRLCARARKFDPARSMALFGMDIDAAANSPYEIPDHVEGFPPCALFLAAQDELVDPEHSRLLAAALEKRGIPCRLEIGPTGGHGFADGKGMCMEGWIGRAARWAQSMQG